VNVKLKLLFFLLIILFTFSAHSQAPADSVQKQLEQYKKLFENNDIGKEEYEQKKAELMGSHPEAGDTMVHGGKQGKTVLTKAPVIDSTQLEIRKVDTMSMAALKDRYKGKIVAGSVILSVGTAFWVGDCFFARFSPKPNSTNADTLASEKVTRQGAEIALGVLGGVASIGGAVFMALGLKDKAVYRRRGKELTMNFTGQEIQIAFVF